MSETNGRGDSLYLFFCHLEWRRTNNLVAYDELLAGLDDSNPDIRILAEVLLRQDARELTQQSQVLNAGEALDESRARTDRNDAGKLADIRR